MYTYAYYVCIYIYIYIYIWGASWRSRAQCKHSVCPRHGDSRAQCKPSVCHDDSPLPAPGKSLERNCSPSPAAAALVSRSHRVLSCRALLRGALRRVAASLHVACCEHFPDHPNPLSRDIVYHKHCSVAHH